MSIDRFKYIIEKITDREFGLINSVQEKDSYLDNFFIFNSSIQRKLANKGLQSVGSGAWYNKETAYEKSIGELFERYCANFYGKDTILDSYKNLSRRMNTLKPYRVKLFSSSQLQDKNFYFNPFNETTKIRWVMGYSLTNKKHIMLPAQLCYLSPSLKDEIPIGYSTSTGLGFGIRLIEALMPAIYEVIERDAFAVRWLTYLSPQKICLEDIFCHLSKELQDILNFTLSDSPFKLDLFDTTLDIGIPSILAVLSNNIKIPYLVLGSATSLDIIKALEKAIVEALHIFCLTLTLKKEAPGFFKNKFSNIMTFKDHGKFWALNNYNKAIKWIYSGEKANIKDYLSVKTSLNYKEQLKICQRELEGRGYEIIFVDISRWEIVEMGYKVIKVVIPGLQPLDGPHSYRFLGNPRIYKIANKYGKRIKNEKHLNPYPHPFP